MRLPLNILVNRVCDASCPFCIENTNGSDRRNLDERVLMNSISSMFQRDMIQDILLLGGEPIHHPYIIEVIRNLPIPPIITTNAQRLTTDRFFLEEISRLSIRAINFSIPHHSQKIRQDIMKYRSFNNGQLRDTVGILNERDIPSRMNTVLLKSHTSSLKDIEEMISFREEMGFKEIKFRELIGHDEHIHDFINDDVLSFNKQEYTPVPVTELYQKYHEFGGSHLWKITESGTSVFFNTPSDFAISGGFDKEGNRYHRILFNDGKIGYSWRRDDGIYTLQQLFEIEERL